MGWNLEGKKGQEQEQGFPLKTEATAQRVPPLVSRGKKNARERERKNVIYLI